MNTAPETRILVLGGGFGGLYAALHLDKAFASDPSVEVTLVSRENYTLFTPMLHEVAAGELEMSDIVNPICKMLRRAVFFEAEAHSIDLPNRRVIVSPGVIARHQELAFDYAIRVAKQVGKNIAAAIRGGRKKPFTFSTLGQLATIGRRTGVANILGLNFSGFIAWFLWRSIYLLKLPRFEKKVRVALGWTLNLLFPPDLAQYVTVRDIESWHEHLTHLRKNALEPGPPEMLPVEALTTEPVPYSSPKAAGKVQR